MSVLQSDVSTPGHTFTLGYVTVIINELCIKACINTRDIEIDKYIGCVMNLVSSCETEADIRILIANEAAARISTHWKYSKLAAAVYIDHMHKTIPQDMYTALSRIDGSRFSEEYLSYVKTHSKELTANINYHRDYNFNYPGIITLINTYLFKSADLENKTNILRLNELQMELPQHMYMRVSISIFGIGAASYNDTHAGNAGNAGISAGNAVGTESSAVSPDVLKHYNMTSCQKLSHATPTLTNAGTRKQQLSSCFMFSCGDSMDSLMTTVNEVGFTAQTGGGVSICVSSVRGSGALIKSSGGRSRGVVPYIQLLEKLQAYVNQGGTRPGAFAIYVEPWHVDIFDFIKLSRPKYYANASTLKYAIYMPDLLMRKIEAVAKGCQYVSDEEREMSMTADDFYLFSPNTTPDLVLLHGEKFNKRYYEYVRAGIYMQKVKVSDILHELFISWKQSGTPYVLFKDTINRYNMMQNIAPVVSSNLCCEITIPSWPESDKERFNSKTGEIGVCNLAAICLKQYVLPNACVNLKIAIGKALMAIPESTHASITLGTALDTQAITHANMPADASYADTLVKPRLSDVINFHELIEAVKVTVQALNIIIDINAYNVDNCRKSNQQHRPIGIGTMGLTNVFRLLKIPYGSPIAMYIDRQIHAAIYYAAVVESCRMAKQKSPFPSINESRTGLTSPYKSGLLHPDMYVANGLLATDWEDTMGIATGGRVDAKHWSALRQKIRKYGVKNSLHTALMPTASTSIITGQYEGVEPASSLMYPRHISSGQLMMVDCDIINDLIDIGLWNETTRNSIIRDGGSIQAIQSIPNDIRRRYKIARELDPRLISACSNNRAPFVDQSQSLNQFVGDLTLTNIISLLHVAWKGGSKTGSYYMHSVPANSGMQSSTLQSSATDTKAAEDITEIAEEEPLVCTRENGCIACGC